jgi:hypothetical protein
MEAVCFCETPVSTYKSTLSYNPEDQYRLITNSCNVTGKSHTSKGQLFELLIPPSGCERMCKHSSLHVRVLEQVLTAQRITSQQWQKMAAHASSCQMVPTWISYLLIPDNIRQAKSTPIAIYNCLYRVSISKDMKYCLNYMALAKSKTMIWLLKPVPHSNLALVLQK